MHSDVAAFASLAMPFFGRDPVRHTSALSAVSGLRRGGAESALVTAHDEGRLRAVLPWTRPLPVPVSGVPVEASRVVATAVAEMTTALGAVNGPRAEAEAFVSAWTGLTGASVTGDRTMILYELGELSDPRPVPGLFRFATSDEVDLVARWRRDFAAEALPWQPEDPDPAGTAATVITERTCGLWCVGGTPVATAQASRPECGMARISYVYTPPEHRGRGYGAAVSAAISRHLRHAGVAHVVLYADQANPTSNALYQRLGYRRILDFANLPLTPPTG
ncbi:putative GNAT family acetyltransferase [Prauserella shujinwangii]|uniref:Putative GNAT family acetyltransferase n=1 Tax=Prauserella shujinwangii TaxID=1453103 RepID=A0A2T0LKR7_9PSEU|nr:putative GNAT family acetyltransferase [Prauserella shujinwangii]